MAKIAKELSATEVRKLKPGTHSVGGVAGLMLVVRNTGARSWILRAMVGNKRRHIGLGAYPGVTLKDAREKARESRELITQGIDPVIQRKEALEALKASQAKRMTFAEAARHCHAAKAPEFKSIKHSANWLATLENHVFPAIGSVQVSEIDVHHILKVLEPIWQTKTETATRIRQRMEAALAWASVSGYREGDNPARWQENLDQLLPKANKIQKTKHFPALIYTRIGKFMAELGQREGMGARALEFAILTASRSGEVREAQWSEIDLDGKVWTVPAERMKSGKAHKVPLSDSAITLLEALPRLSEIVFPSSNGKPLSDNTLRATIIRMHEDDLAAGGDGWVDYQDGRRVVPHGFRSSFKDWARNMATKYRDEVSELALAHVNSDATRSAYARDELLPQRTLMMADWATYCGEPIEPGTVSKMERRA